MLASKIMVCRFAGVPRIGRPKAGRCGVCCGVGGSIVTTIGGLLPGRNSGAVGAARSDLIKPHYKRPNLPILTKELCDAI
jgi:hypothetical protein